MNIDIKTIANKQMLGKSLKMSLSENKTFELWQSFMPLLKQVNNKINHNLYSIQAYDPPFDAASFTVHTPFIKWAAVEVSQFKEVPVGLQPFILQGGTYAVFTYKGNGSDFGEVIKTIHQTWLPASGYIVANRPHFEILGEKYRLHHPDSEEEIWIPVEPEILH